MARIIVGVDASVESANALGWAVDEARLRGLELAIAHVYEPPRAARPVLVTAPYTVNTGVLQAAAADAEARTRELYEGAIARAEQLVERTIEGAGVDLVGLDWSIRVVPDRRPARALTRLARPTDLLVVGSHGRSGRTAFPIGSVSQGCLHQAPCPVVVVRRTD